MSTNLTDAEKLKRQRLIMTIGIVAVGTVAFILGRVIGYNKGFDKAVGWQ